jgi:hypothetical protein
MADGFPKTLAELVKRGYRPSEGRDGTNAGRCRNCGDDIEWWSTPLGKKVPMNPMLRDQDPAVAHWDVCSGR